MCLHSNRHILKGLTLLSFFSLFARVSLQILPAVIATKFVDC